jgi:hypothetical protein
MRMSIEGTMKTTTIRVALLLSFAAVPPVFAHTAEDCTAFTWDLSREFAAMRAPATPVSAMPRKSRHPSWLELGRHYSATLLPQNAVKFVLPPGRQRKSGQPMAGLLYFRTEKAGRYRIALTTSHWIDALDGANVIDSTSHEGRSGCGLLHKVVEFELPANRAITLQISGQDAATVGITVNPV